VHPGDRAQEAFCKVIAERVDRREPEAFVPRAASPSSVRKPFAFGSDPATIGVVQDCVEIGLSEGRSDEWRNRRDQPPLQLGSLHDRSLVDRLSERVAPMSAERASFVTPPTIARDN
jgi:hypothetical protein